MNESKIREILARSILAYDYVSVYPEFGKDGPIKEIMEKKDPEKVQEKTPEKAPASAPEKVQEKTPEKIPVKAPAKSRTPRSMSKPQRDKVVKDFLNKQEFKTLLDRSTILQDFFKKLDLYPQVAWETPGGKMANNILDFLIDPTRVPVKQRVYFRPEEILKNEGYEKAKAEAFQAYKDQKHNNDFYPQRNRTLTREANIMDRKSLIASLDILSKNFKDESDPFAKDLRVMAMALSKMTDENFSARQASDAPELEGALVEAKAKTFPCPKCKTNVLQQTGYCVKCKKKVKKAEDETVKEASTEEIADFWTKEASDAVLQALRSDFGIVEADDAEKAPEVPEEVPIPKKEEPVEVPPKKEEAPAPEKKEEKTAAAPALEEKPIVDPVEKKEEEKPVKAEEKGMKSDKDAKTEEASIVNTDVLASVKFADIEIPMSSLDEIGELSDIEKANLAKLF